MTIILFFIILGALIFVHELGHFLVAKRAGIRVDEFALGFPPRLFSKTVGETKYSLNLIPFGGYVKIYGEDGDEDVPNTNSHEHPETLNTTNSSSSAPFKGEVPRERGEGVVDMERSMMHKPKYVQAAVLSAGVFGNIVFAWLLISLGFMMGVPSTVNGRYADEVRDAHLAITQVLPDSPAEKAGLLAGDRVVLLEAGGERFAKGSAEAAREFISSGSGELTVHIERNEHEEKITVMPQEGIVPGKLGIGVVLEEVGTVRFNPVRSLYEGFLTTVDLVWGVAKGLVLFIGQAFTGQARLGDITGPVGIAGLVGEARTLGLVYLLSFTAFISINLAVINLLPFPALDGGRLFFLLIEAVSRRQIPVRVSRFLNALGFILLILLMVVITYRDIVKLI
ncbi:MAG: RIP metalloprotease RseP [bacterium]|nr:RIP metalloprotease RseP [bacterium]